MTIFAAPGSGTIAFDINNKGEITGADIDGMVVHGFLRAYDGTLTTFDAPGSNYTNPIGINRAGEITGFYLDSNVAMRGFLRARDGTLTAVDFPGAILTSPVGINSKGVVVGVYNDANFRSHGFLRAREGTFTPFDAPNSADTIPYAINSAGAITGVVNGSHGFIRIEDNREEDGQGEND